MNDYRRKLLNDVEECGLAVQRNGELFAYYHKPKNVTAEFEELAKKRRSRVIVVVEGGVASVYSDDPHLNLTVLDLDVNDPEKDDDFKEEYGKVFQEINKAGIHSLV